MTDPDRAGRPRVRAVVLNYNGGAHVLRCLTALRATDWPTDALEVVVVDNASTDGSDAAIVEQHPWVRLVRSPSNTGFPANNLGMRDLDDVDHVALVNNDAFVTPGWLGPLVDALEADASLGAACPKIVFAPTFVDVHLNTDTFRAPGDGRDLGVRISGIEVAGDDVWGSAQLHDGCWGVEDAGLEPRFSWTDARAVVRVPIEADLAGPVAVRLRLTAERTKSVALTTDDGSTRVEVGPSPTWVELTAAGPGYDVINNVGSKIVPLGFGADRGYLERDTGQYEAPADVFAWCGGGVLLRREYLESTGLFDERFFLYYEDTDLSWRGRAQGWAYRYVPTSVVRHLHAASSGEGSPLFQHYVERNRLLMLLKNAPVGLIVHAVLRYLRMLLTSTWRQAVAPLAHRRRPALGLVRRRLRSLAGAARLTPAMLRSRRELRKRQVVRDADLVSWIGRA